MNKIAKKPLVAMDISTAGRGGGPYVSNIRIMESGLKNKYDFKRIEYKAKIGSGISLRRIFDLKKQLLNLRPDIVHFTGLQLSGFHLAVACKLAHIKNSILTVHGFSGDAIDFHPIKKIILTYFLEPLTLLLTKRIYGVSKYVVSRRLVKLFNYKCDGIIYNFSPDAYRDVGGKSIREELNLLNSDILAVSVGRIIKDKGYHVLDAAILKLQIHSNLKFLIVGNGDYLETMRIKLKTQIEKKQVFFLGYRDDIQNILNGCDIFILPTFHETLSIALLEASVEGLALISSNTGGVPEIVENNYNGLLVSPGSVIDLVDAIDKLFNNDVLRKRFGENSKLRIMGHFSNISIEKKIDEIYFKMLNHGSFK